MEPMSFKRPLIITAVLATLLVATGVSIDALTFAPLGLLVVFWQILRALYYVLRRNWPALKLCGLRLLIWIAAMFVLVMVHDYYQKITQKSADTLVAALQTYRAREGRYPRELDALAPRDIAQVPLTVNSPGAGRPFRYRLDGDAGERYTLSFNSGFRLQHIYDSTTKKWELRD